MSLKGILRSALDRLAKLTGVLACRERMMRRGITILMYHRVLPDRWCADYPLKALAMPVSAFREQLRWLAARCRVLPVRQAIEQSSECDPRDRPRVSVTFDDGYSDSYEIAAPIMEEAGVRGTFFVTVDFIGREQLLWFDRAAVLWLHGPREAMQSVVREVSGHACRHTAKASSLDSWLDVLKHIAPRDRSNILDRLDDSAVPEIRKERCRSMSVEEIVALHERGHEIASHTLSHPILTQLGDAEMLNELMRSRQMLERWLGARACGLSYPNGAHDGRIVRGARAAGYTYACRTMGGMSLPQADSMRLPRVGMWPDLVTTAGGLHDPLRFRSETCLMYHPLRRARDSLKLRLTRID